MSEEMKKVELTDEELVEVTGGLQAGQEATYKCRFCCQPIVVHSNAEVLDHLAACPWNPKNMK